ncbi:unnamed protein product [Durusdinium trenchii]|uniref:Peroxin-1 n=2 Tax=Durusdinium trenchii TaxID=1381693 RepID=A0ABP0S3P9_9DINO
MLQSVASEEESVVPVSSIRWSHDSVRVVFQDGCLVATMLKELLDGDLLPHQIPQIDVFEDGGVLYAWSGNRRLWVLKEFERLRRVEVKVQVKKKVTKLSRKSPKFSTTNDGESVTFFSQSRADCFPSMSFALAAINPPTAPTMWDVELGNEIRRSSGSALWKLQRIGELGGWLEAPPSSLEDYLHGKPYLFTVVDFVVTLTGCMEALTLLGLDAGPHLKISSLESLEQDGTGVRDGDPSECQFAEAEIWDGFTESSLEEALRSVCAPQPLSLFAIPELVGLRNNPDTCQLVLSFLKRRSNIFSLSSSVFGHSVSLIDSPPRHTEKYGLGGNDSKDEPDTSMPQNHVADRSEARASEVLNSLSSHLCSVINEAGGRLSLDRLEWDQVCMAQFASQVDLEKYLEEQPHFLIWVSEGGKMVSTVSADTRQPGGQAGAFRMLLPSRLNSEISREVLEILQSTAHRLLYRADSSMKVALRSGWLEPAMLPSTVLCQKDLDDLAKRLGWRKLPGLVPIPGSPHRAHFKSSDSDRLRSITIHVGRYLPGLWSKAGDLLDAGSTIFVGPAGCGKTTILRDVAVNMSKELQVLVLDFLGHLADMESSPDLDYQCWGSGSEAQTIREAIDEHVPEVIVAEFPDTYSALRAGRVCAEAGVRLACSVRSNLRFLVESFVHAYSGSQQVRDLACLTFPFASAVQLSRQMDEWDIYRDAPAVVCSMGRCRLPTCDIHQGFASQHVAGDVGSLAEMKDTAATSLAVPEADFPIGLLDD